MITLFTHWNKRSRRFTMFEIHLGFFEGFRFKLAVLGVGFFIQI